MGVSIVHFLNIKKYRNLMTTYFKYTHLASYNFLFAGLLLVLYEASIRIVPAQTQIINGVDAWLQSILALLPPYSTLGVCVLVLLIGAYLTYKDIKSGIEIKTQYFIGMGVESTVWAMVMYFNLAYLVAYLMGETTLPNQASEHETNWLQNMSLSLGAGFYEELFFRLFLVQIFQFGLYITGISGASALGRGIIAVSTAVLFSLAHFDFVLGSTGEAFTLYAFVFRFIFGLFMSLLLMLRGFAVAAWSHAIYDMMVFSLRALSS